ncbi:hypothetical protein [Nostoc sp.]|uniref:hypothetical protein n=1 Tax=Nostoc sp. TaxID=1180 RepID=UPI002FFBFE3F
MYRRYETALSNKVPTDVTDSLPGESNPLRVPDAIAYLLRTEDYVDIISWQEIKLDTQ